MNKKDVIRIAKSIFLQQSISRQLFAKFNEHQNLQNLESDLLRKSNGLRNNFLCFIGSENKDDILQFIKKDGLKFTVYGITSSAKVNSNVSKSIKGFDLLLTYLHTMSAQIVATGESFNRNLKELLNYLTLDVYNHYNSDLQNEEIFNNISQKAKSKKWNEEQKDTFFKRQIVSNIINKWLDDINNMLNVIQKKTNSIQIFYIDNSQSGAGSFLNNIRNIVNNNVSDYLDNLNLNMSVQNIVNQIKRNLMSKNGIAQLLNTSKNDTSHTQINIDDISKKFSNVCTKIDKIQEIVTQLKSHINDSPIVEQLLNIIDNSNTTQQLQNNMQQILGIQSSTEIDKYVSDNGVDLNKDVTLRSEMSASKFKQYIYTFINFIFGTTDVLNFNSWHNAYEGFFIPTLQHSNQLLNVFNQFNNIIVFFQNNTDNLFKYCLCQRVIISGRPQSQVFEATSTAQQIQNELKSSIASATSDGNTIISNVTNYLINLAQKNIGGTNAKVNIKNKLLNSVQQEFFEGTNIVSKISQILKADIQLDDQTYEIERN